MRPGRNKDLELCIVKYWHNPLNKVISESFVEAKYMRGIFPPNKELIKAGSISQMKVDKLTPFTCFMLLY